MAEQSERSHIDLNQLKAGGFIKELGKDLFSVRLRVPGGRMAVSCLKKIVEVAEKYGGEFVHLSVRQSIELVHVNFKHIGDVAEELGMVRQKVASCGARVRVPVACGGCEYNPKGLMDTQKSALEIDAKLFGTETGHHKFKVAFAGCSSDCPKSATNDVGFQGAVLPVLDKDACVGCGLCIKICPTEAWKAGKRGYTVRIGGKWGRNPLVGTLFATFLPEEKVADFISAVLAWYRKNSEGLGRIRLGDVIIRQGTEGLLSDLRNKFPQHAVEATIPPQVIDTQIGKRP
ncbi:MAG: sulfite reductase [Syntrophus sp. RIFOXYC2_FULL_54_9]|nr:MAG: sulfite reductase [Syntrophus sp. RIFOXYC2_FULL_54_9]